MLDEGRRERVEGVVVVERAGHEPDAVGQPPPDVLAEPGPRALLGRLARQRLEVAVAPVAAGEAEQGEARRQQAAVGEVVDRRDQLLARQVAGDAEHDQRARARDARQPPVADVAQRVVADGAPRVRVRRDVDQGRVARGHAAGLPAASARRAAGDARRPVGEVQAYGGAGPLLEGAQVAERLGHLQPAERERPAGHVEVAGDGAGDLEEDADLRSALVELAGRVQEPRPPAEGHLPAVGGPGQPRPGRPAAAPSPSRSR